MKIKSNNLIILIIGVALKWRHKWDDFVTTITWALQNKSFLHMWNGGTFTEFFIPRSFEGKLTFTLVLNQSNVGNPLHRQGRAREPNPARWNLLSGPRSTLIILAFKSRNFGQNLTNIFFNSTYTRVIKMSQIDFINSLKPLLWKVEVLL